MSLRELVVLGTSSQVPTRYRNHNGYLLRWDGHGVLFDPGEGTQRQMLLHHVAPSSINRICITHFHGDHCLGLPGVVQRLSLDGVTHDVPCHFHASAQRYYDRLRHASIFVDKSPVRAAPFEGPGLLDRFGDLQLEAHRLAHTTPSYGYRLVEDDGWTLDGLKAREAGITGPHLGELKREGQVTVGGVLHQLPDYATRRRGQVVAFLMDTKPCEAAVEAARGADLLICESTYLAEMTAEAHERGHMTAADAGKLAAEAGAGQLVLTHFSQRYPDASVFEEEARAHFPHVRAAAEGDRIPVRRPA